MHDLRGRTSERRQLTVLFCDIVDSTGLSERCDPEDLSEILLEFQAISTRCIKDAGGNVVNYIGDGIRCRVRIPSHRRTRPKPQYAPAWCCCAPSSELERALDGDDQEPLRVRIGVHTGVAVIGKAAAGPCAPTQRRSSAIRPTSHSGCRR